MKNVALDFLYNPTVDVSIMSNSLAYALFDGDEPLTPTDKLLKIPSGEVIKSHGIARMVPITINEITILLNFYIFEIRDFDLLIGHPLKKLLEESQYSGSLDVDLGKSINLSIPLTQSANSKAELNPEPVPMEEVMSASLLDLSESNLEDDAQHFI